ncbi:MAG: GIY-YIG nuclease family protein [archaeon]|nr:GIY-YIG nuclease family protein [archaeon]
MYYIYLAKCRDGTYYCGYTANLENRIETHNKGMGAKYTKKRRPITLVYSEQFETRSLAMKRELEIKKMGHMQKIILARGWQK